MRTTTNNIWNKSNTVASGHSLQMEVLEEMRTRRTRDDTAPRWTKLYMLVIAVTLTILVLHPFIMQLVDSNI
jgi:hypothetical protein